ncbi:MAG: hypothetical protein ABI476_10565 [Oxalobacteraceae bacterium]
MSNDTIDRAIACDAKEIHLSAYNTAFYELGLRWYWDTASYQALLSCTDEKSGIRKYIETSHPHLLNAYDADFLVAMIHAEKTRCYGRLVACGARITPTVDWAAMQSAEVGF